MIPWICWEIAALLIHVCICYEIKDQVRFVKTLTVNPTQCEQTLQRVYEQRAFNDT